MRPKPQGGTQGGRRRGAPKGTPTQGGPKGRKRPAGEQAENKKETQGMYLYRLNHAPLSPSEPWNLQKPPLDREGDYDPPGFADNGAPLLGARGQT